MIEAYSAPTRTTHFLIRNAFFYAHSHRPVRPHSGFGNSAIVSVISPFGYEYVRLREFRTSFSLEKPESLFGT